MYSIKWKDNTETVFDTEQKMNDLIFDRGYEQKGNKLYHAFDGGRIVLVGKIVRKVM